MKQQGSLYHTENERGQRFKLYERKVLFDVLSREGVELPLSFFDSPKRSESIIVMRYLVCLVFGCTTLLNNEGELRLLLTECLTNCFPNSLQYDSPTVQSLKLNMLLPENGEKHLMGVSTLVLYRYMQQFGEMCGIDNVSLADLLCPTGPRMLIYLSALVDYIYFQKTYMPDACKKWEEVHNDRSEIAITRHKTLQLKKEHAILEQESEMRNAELVNLKSQEEQLKDNLRKVSNRLELITQEIAVKQEEEQIVQKTHNDLEKTIKNFKLRIEQLKDQIIDSPEAITEKLASLELQTQETDARLENITQDTEVARIHRDIMNWLLDRFKYCHNLVTQIHKIYSDCQLLSDELSKHNTSTEQLELQIKTVEDDKLKTQTELKNLTESLQVYEREYNQLKNCVEQLKIHQTKIHKSIEEFKEHKRQMLEKLKIQKGDLQTSIQAMEQHTDRFIEQEAQFWQACNTAEESIVDTIVFELKEILNELDKKETLTYIDDIKNELQQQFLKVTATKENYLDHLRENISCKQ